MPFEIEYEDQLELEPVWFPQREAPSTTGVPAPADRDQFSIRMSVVGHASPRWKTAKNITEADRRNMRLSQQRAHNVRQAVAKVLRKELPGVAIELGEKAVGSRQPFPGPYSDNRAIDRSVVVELDLTTKSKSYTTRSNPPRRVFAPSKFWEVTVVDVTKVVAGVALLMLRIVLKNYITGKEIVLSGKLAGGGMSSKVFDFGGKINPGAIGKPIGDKIIFETPEALTFSDFDGQVVRVGKVDVKFGIGADMSYLTFPLLHHRPELLIFEHHRLKLGFPGAEGFVVAGKMHLEGSNPGDWYEVPSAPDLVPIQKTYTATDALVVTFPTGRAGLSDLTSKDRKRLLDFVTNKARNVGVFLKSPYFQYVK